MALGIRVSPDAERRHRQQQLEKGGHEEEGFTKPFSVPRGVG